ncbi:MAG TPA: alpha/beta hydrolase [Myxococcales bacterium]|nr:alpha/beta hydrolase [Myxococcales bacterium]
MTALLPSTTQFTTSRDGARIGWERFGAGPALAVMHGGGRAAKHYRELASALAGQLTVLLVDRRGRGLSGPVGAGNAVEEEVADLAAVMEATGARDVFGHSGGAATALQAALRLPIRRLALYEPPVGAPVPLGWLPAYREALAKDRPVLAMVLLAQGLQMGAPAWLPPWALELPIRPFVRGETRREMAALLGTLPRELEVAGSLMEHPERCAEVRCPTLLMGGMKSPRYLQDAVDFLARTIPGARKVMLEGVGHNAPDIEAPAKVAAELARFFSET